MQFSKGQAVLVVPPSYQMQRHRGEILRKAKYGWRVRFGVAGVWITETMPESALTPYP